MINHVAVFGSCRKELHIFDNERVDWEDMCPVSVDSSLSHNLPDKGLIDFTPIYSYWPPSIARIHRYNASARLILILRDPVARAYSHWRMAQFRKNDLLGFGEAIRGGRRRVPSGTEFPGYNRRFSYVERGFYTEQIGRILGHFPENQVLFLQTHDLRTDHEGTLDKVCDFLGVPRFEAYPKAETVFSHWRPEMDRPDQADIDYLYDLFDGEFRRVRLLTGIDLFREYERSR